MQLLFNKELTDYLIKYDEWEQSDKGKKFIRHLIKQK